MTVTTGMTAGEEADGPPVGPQHLIAMASNRSLSLNTLSLEKGVGEVFEMQGAGRDYTDYGRVCAMGGENACHVLPFSEVFSLSL